MSSICRWDVISITLQPVQKLKGEAKITICIQILCTYNVKCEIWALVKWGKLLGIKSGIQSYNTTMVWWDLEKTTVWKIMWQILNSSNGWVIRHYEASVIGLKNRFRFYIAVYYGNKYHGISSLNLVVISYKKHKWFDSLCYHYLQHWNKGIHKSTR